MGQFNSKDGTAQGVAKARHYEALWDESERLFYDPYAQDMYPGSFAQAWLGTSTTKWLYDLMGPGILELLLIRTKWIDDQILNLAPTAKQLIVLGAGYDTRGFRLALPETDFKVWEIDQHEVQKKKIANMERIAKNDSTVASKLKEGSVQFIPIDFNVDSLVEKVKSGDGFQTGQPSLILMEGVTQYIPKASTADTITKLKSLVAPGSILLITYVDQNIFDDPSKVGPQKSCSSLLKIASAVGEPWISTWTETEFQSFMKDLGYEVLSNTCAKDYNEAYMVPLGRGMQPVGITSIERFVTAKML